MAEKDEKDDRIADREGTFRDNEGYGEHEMNALEREQATQMMDPARRREIRARFEENKILPPVPKHPRFHRCWVNTSHSTDTPESRLRAGYRFSSRKELEEQGWIPDRTAVKDATILGDDHVRWRELILMELPMNDFVDYMKVFHDDIPRENTLGIFERLDWLAQQAKEKGGKITLEEGMEELRRRMMQPPVRQFEV